MIGPEWLTRITHRARWGVLDEVAGMAADAVHVKEAWLRRADVVRAEELWRANLMAALAQQVFDQCVTIWHATYRGDRTLSDAEHERLTAVLAWMGETREMELAA